MARASAVPCSAGMPCALAGTRSRRRLGARCIPAVACSLVVAGAYLCCARVALGSVCSGHRGSFPATGFAVVPQGRDPPRRSALLGAVALGLGPAAPLVLVPGDVAYAEEVPKWKQDIPRALKALREVQDNWEFITISGKERQGAEKVRALLQTRYEEILDITIPPDRPVGAKVKACEVTEVVEKAPGWMEEDFITAVNGVSTSSDGFSKCGEDTLLLQVKQSREAKEPVVFTVSRTGPTPFTGLENKLKTAYMALEDPDLPDLEELQVALGNAKALTQAAASAPSAADKVLPDLRMEIDRIVKDLNVVAKAVA